MALPQARLIYGMTMDYRQTTDFLFNSFPLYQNIGAGAYKEGLDNISSFCGELGNPQERFLTIHVAGTNGKGSVSHTLASILQKAGYRTGLFTSPHLVDFRERIRINGSMVSEKDVVDFVARHGQRMKGMGLSFFEMTTAMAFSLFAEKGVEVAVIETGLGGRLDATNIIRPLLSVITNIGLEHIQLLGDTIGKIAAEKAGIIKPGVPVVIGESNEQSDPVFLESARQRGSSIAFADRTWSVAKREDCGTTVKYSILNDKGDVRTLDYDLKGNYQARNIVTVITAVETLRSSSPLDITDSSIEQGCCEAASGTGLQGRWQVLSQTPLVVCDTAHNAHGLGHVAKQIDETRMARHDCRLFMVFGMVNDKDFNNIMPLLPKGEYIFTQPSVARALPAKKLQAKAAEFGLQGCVVADVAQAYRTALERASAEDMVYVGGSSFVVADLLKALGQSR